MPYTLNFHRVLKAPQSRVYKAFLDAAAMAKWLYEVREPGDIATARQELAEAPQKNHH